MATPTDRLPAIPPALVLSTGRCGSTMVSDILNRHPQVLSLSEFFSFVGLGPFRRRRRCGADMWRFYSRQQRRTRMMLQGRFEELLYPVDDPAARFTRQNVPPILCATLPHITEHYEALYDELGPAVCAVPKQGVAEHYRALFAWLCRRFNRAVWAERSGGSLMLAARLLREFPEARVIHVYRDGREVALSMRRHYLFRMIVATMRALRRLGIDLLGMLRRGHNWDRVSLWMEPTASALFRPDRLNYDRLTLADFGAYWSAMVEYGHRLFQGLPPGALLNVKFEDMQADPEGQLRRLIRFLSPELEDEAWVNAAATIPRPTTSRFAGLDAAEQAAVAEACRPGLDILGYAT